MRSCLRTCFEREINGRYLVSVGTMENGYSGEWDAFVSVFDYEALDFIEDKDIPFEDMFHVFCEMCRKYEKL